MPTIITHAAFSYAAWRVLGPRLGAGVLVLGAVLSMLPDLDVIAFVFGIPYEHPLGHRGFTHSLPFSVAVATLVWLYVRSKTPQTSNLWLFLLVSAASHPVFDAFTNGGLGVAFFSPLSNARFFFPFRPIEVSPIGLQAFLSSRGAVVLSSELLWIWLPTVLISGMAWITQKRRRDKVEE